MILKFSLIDNNYWTAFCIHTKELKELKELNEVKNAEYKICQLSLDKYKEGY